MKTPEILADIPKEGTSPLGEGGSQLVRENKEGIEGNSSVSSFFVDKLPVNKMVLTDLVGEYEDYLNLLIGILNDNGVIQLSDYQLKNIHEFLKVFCQPNINEQSALS